MSGDMPSNIRENVRYQGCRAEWCSILKNSINSGRQSRKVEANLLSCQRVELLSPDILGLEPLLLQV